MLSRSAVYALTAVILIGLGSLGAALYWWSPHATVRITTGPLGSNVERFISALTAVSKDQHPLVRFEPVQVNSLKESSAQLEAGKVDLAIVRTDVAPPTNGQTIAILRHDAVGLLVLPTRCCRDPAGGARSAIGVAGRPSV